jgi:hypothetical protein
MSSRTGRLRTRLGVAAVRVRIEPGGSLPWVVVVVDEAVGGGRDTGGGGIWRRRGERGGARRFDFGGAGRLAAGEKFRDGSGGAGRSWGIAGERRQRGRRMSRRPLAREPSVRAVWPSRGGFADIAPIPTLPTFCLVLPIYG